MGLIIFNGLTTVEAWAFWILVTDHTQLTNSQFLPADIYLSLPRNNNCCVGATSQTCSCLWSSPPLSESINLCDLNSVTFQTWFHRSNDDFSEASRLLHSPPSTIVRSSSTSPSFFRPFIFIRCCCYNAIELHRSKGASKDLLRDVLGERFGFCGTRSWVHWGPCHR